MAKTFDATLNDLIDVDPATWADCFGRLAGVPPGPSTSEDTDLATALQCDRLFRIACNPPSLLHLEFVSNPRLGIPHELLRYNSFASHVHRLPAESVLVLLRPRAQASDQTGTYQQYGATGKLIVDFCYHVLRVWERPISFWLNAGLNLAPLAVVTDEAEADLEGCFSRVAQALQNRAAPGTKIEGLLNSAFLLCGLRYGKDRIDDLSRSATMSVSLEDSSTYQWILERGKREAFRNMLMSIGTKRLGSPSEATSKSIREIEDPARLEFLVDGAVDATDWDELLRRQAHGATP